MFAKDGLRRSFSKWPIADGCNPVFAASSVWLIPRVSLARRNLSPNPPLESVEFDMTLPHVLL